MRTLALALLLAGASSSVAPAADPSAAAGDWPQFLGPHGTGVVDAPGTFAGAFRLRKAWGVPLEGGAAGPTVANGHVYTLASEGETDVALAFAASDGKPLWRVPLDKTAAGAGDGPSSTPAVLGDRVFTVSTACRLRAHDAATGAVAWDVDLVQKFGAAARRGCQSSPIAVDGRLVLQTAGADDHRVAAFDPRSGAVLWSARGVERATYSTPTVGSLAGERQILVHHVTQAQPPQPQRSGITALRPADGRLLWHHTLPRHVSLENPVVLPGDRVAITTWNDVQVVKVARSGDTFTARDEWSSQDLISNVSPPVVFAGHVFGFARDHLSCLRPEGGPPVWSERLYPGSTIVADGHLVVLGSTSGVLRVAAADASGWKEKASIQALSRGARAHTAAAVAAGRVFVRGEDELVAIAVER